MRLFDTHCHLTDKKILSEVDKMIEAAKGVGVNKFLTMGGGRDDWNGLEKIANRFEEVYLAFGWHPEEIRREEDLEDLREKMKNPRAVAIGETGLDFYWDKEKKTKEFQMIMLEQQISLSKEINKPIIIHCRGAEEEMLEILERHDGFRAHFHCFGESEKLLKKAIDCGHMISFGGNVTFKSAQKLRDLLKMVPLSQLMLETDAPYLSPEPLRGVTNEPSHLLQTAHFIAKELKIEVDTLANTTYKNALCFFGLEN